MSYTNYSRNKYRNLCRPMCHPINVIVQDDNIKKPTPHLYYPNYPDLGYPNYSDPYRYGYPGYYPGGYPGGYLGGYPGGYPYGYPGIRPFVQTNQGITQDETMPKPKSRSIEKTILNPKSKSKTNIQPHFYYDSSSSSSSSSSDDYIYRSHAKVSHPIPDPIIDPIIYPENIVCTNQPDTIPDMIPNRVFDESIKKKQDDCQNPKNYTKPFAKLVSKFTTPETKALQIEIEPKPKENIEKDESLGNLEKEIQKIQENQQNQEIQQNQKIENDKNDKKIYLK